MFSLTFLAYFSGSFYLTRFFKFRKNFFRLPESLEDCHALRCKARND
ncbi:MAG: hypothetical protein IKN18_04330 [Neisseriaceae bacterium]|nr:hypothetical protein [Neisseriaceae bacterium]